MLSGLRDRLLGPAARIDEILEQTVWSLADVALVLPITAVAAVLGLVVWRGRRPVAGVVVALSVHVAAMSAPWAVTVRTFVAVMIVAALGWPLGVAGQLMARRIVGRRAASPTRRPIQAAAALVVVPLALAAAGAAADLAWLVAAVLASAAVASMVVGVADRGRGWAAVGPHLLGTFGIVVLAGLLGWGGGLGDQLARTLPTGEARAAVSATIAVLAVGIGLAVAGAAPAGVAGDEEGS